MDRRKASAMSRLPGIVKSAIRRSRRGARLAKPRAEHQAGVVRGYRVALLAPPWLAILTRPESAAASPALS